MNIKLLDDRVLVDMGDEKTKSGLIVSKNRDDENQGEYQIGKVVASGPGKYLDNGTRLINGVFVGDKIMFQYGKEVEVEGKKYMLMKAEDVVMILN